MRLTISVALTTLAVSQAAAADAVVSIEIPRLNVVEYHRPYVSFWIENAGGDKVTNLAVWYDTKRKNSEGNKWLKDMRQWWRKVGRELTLPADGVSSPTRAPGTHEISFDAKTSALKDLPAGEYQLIVEAAREVGGREILRVPFQWPPKETKKHDVKGEHEIGALGLTLNP